MTPGIQQLAMFASKNKQVAQISIQVSHVEAVFFIVFNAIFIINTTH